MNRTRPPGLRKYRANGTALGQGGPGCRLWDNNEIVNLLVRQDKQKPANPWAANQPFSHRATSGAK
jgi:hypothetical protein